jgi:hypothetical protein
LRQPDQQQQQQGIGPTNATGCPNNRGPNIQVNQDCQNLTDPDLAGRGEAQNETAVAQDPDNPSHLVVSQNDYRRRDSSCYTAYSTNGGKSWADSTLPFSFTRGDAFGGLPRQYWQAGGDPTVAWDSKGNADQTCLVFQRGPATTQNPDLSSAFYLFRSTGTNGASWNFPGRPVAELNDQTGERLLDKEYMTIDNHKGSPFQDRIYVTWTLFDDDGTAYIFGAYSLDYGETFSTPKLVSADSDACPDVLGVPTPQGRCNENSFSQPFTGPDGALYVVWENFNVTGEAARGEGDEEGGGSDNASSNQAAPTGVDNAHQVLLAKSTDGGNTFSAPVRVSLAYELPDCETYQDATGGSACVPEKGETHNSIFRAANYPSGAVNPKDPRLVHQPPLQRAQRLRAAGLQPRHGHRALRRRQADRRVQQRHRHQQLVERRPDVHRQERRRAPPANGQRPQRQRGPVLAVGGVRPEGPLRGLVLRPRVRQRRADRVLGREPVGLARRRGLRHRARDDLVDAAAVGVRRWLLWRLQRAERR